MSRKVDVFFRFYPLQEWSVPDLAKRERLWFDFGGGGFGQPDVLGATAHQIPDTGGLVDLPSLPFQVRNDDRWIRDVHIEYRAEQPYYSNEDLVYQLPRKNRMAAAFSALPGRIDAGGGLSVEMRPKAPLFLTIPEDRTLILTAIGCGRCVRYTSDFAWKDQLPVFGRHALSDNARYCRGVLDLFGGLQSAHQTFESRFWRRNIYRLANAPEKIAVDADSPLFRNLSKNPQLWAINPHENPDDELHRLEEQIVKFARSVRSREAEITYRFLLEDFRKERAESVAQNPHLGPQSEEEAKHSEADAEVRLKQVLQELVNSKILQQGIVARCHQCGSRIWRELGFIKQQFECPGCGADVRSPVEPRWSYRLNSLVSKAVSEQGTVALINALAEARQKARNSFIFSPGFVFYADYDDKDPVSEVVAICLVDGKLWIGEVKSNAREFSSTIIAKLVADAKKLRADKAFVFAQEGNQGALARCCETASGEIEIIHLYPSGFGSQPSYHV
jgi:rubrerythrin